MSVKSVLLKKKVNDVVYDIYPKTSSDIVTYGDSSTVAAEIASLITNVGTGTVDDRIEAMRKEILGITDGSTIDAAYDTLKEIADWIASDTTASATLVDKVSALETAVGTEAVEGGAAATGLYLKIANVETAVATAQAAAEAAQTSATAASTAATAAQTDVDALEAVVNNETTGLAATKTIADQGVADAATAQAAAEAAQSTADDVATRVTALESENKTEVVVVAEADYVESSVDENDLYFVEITA